MQVFAWKKWKTCKKTCQTYTLSLRCSISQFEDIVLHELGLEHWAGTVIFYPKFWSLQSRHVHSRILKSIIPYKDWVAKWSNNVWFVNKIIVLGPRTHGSLVTQRGENMGGVLDSLEFSYKNQTDPGGSNLIKDPPMFSRSFLVSHDNLPMALCHDASMPL